MTVEKIFNKFIEENPEFPKYILEEAKKHLPAKITDAQTKKVLVNLQEEYNNSLVTPYEAIGVIAAQSVGAEATQMTLNTFHFAGVASAGVEGLPRLIEILDAKKNLSAPMMRVFLDSKFNTEDKVKFVADKIKEARLGDFATGFDVDLENKVVLIDFDLKKIKKLGLELESITKFSDKKLKKNSELVDDKQLKLKGTASASLKDLMTLKELVLSQVVYGIKGISDVTIIKEDDEYIILTAGTALRQVMNIEGVDNSRIYCNDPHEVLKIFGIEASRQVIIQELLDVVKSQGLSINERHVLLVADTMTQSGDLKGMTRYGIVVDKQNVLTKASFEVPLKHLSQGALENEENELTTITENVMTNQMVRVGTGIPKISVREDK